MSFIDLTSLPWFSRIWVKQEYVVSSIVELQYGEHFFSLQDLSTAAYGLYKAAKAREILSDVIAENPQDSWRVPQALVNTNQIANLIGARGDRLNHRSMRPLLHFLWKFWDNEATNPRDKVYALLGLLTTPDALTNLQDPSKLGYDPKSLIVDYGSKVEDVYKSTVKAIVMATRKPNVLCAAQPDGESGFPNMSNLPSWAPDWTRPWKGQGLLQHKILYPSAPRANGEDFRSGAL